MQSLQREFTVVGLQHKPAIVEQRQGVLRVACDIILLCGHHTKGWWCHMYSQHSTLLLAGSYFVTCELLRLQAQVCSVICCYLPGLVRILRTNA